MNTALAYFNWGRWVVDCPQPDCTDAREVKLPNLQEVCFLGHPFQIVMPAESEAVAIAAELTGRSKQGDQSWYPSGHPRAEVLGLPTGQTLAELRAETVEVEARRADQRMAERVGLAEILAQYGIRVGPDGRFEGSL